MENPLLAQAIHQRRILEIRYRNAARTIEPHTYGIGADGHEKLRCWQIGGASDSGERSGWKLLNVSDIRATTMSERQFSSARAGYKRGDTAMRHIYAQL